MLVKLIAPLVFLGRSSWGLKLEVTVRAAKGTGMDGYGGVPMTVDSGEGDWVDKVIWCGDPDSD